MYNTFKYYIFNKPYGVLSQFKKEAPHHSTLADFIDIDKDVYPVGRLDKDSEGLLLLTNDNKLKTYLLSPKNKKEKTYTVQVDGAIDQEAISKLQKGVTINVNKKAYHTLPAKVKLLESVNYPERNPPIRYRANIPTSWVEIKIHEGKNRQIRKMCAKVGFPVLRLIRTKISCISASQLLSGELRELSKKEISTLRENR